MFRMPFPIYAETTSFHDNEHPSPDLIQFATYDFDHPHIEMLIDNIRIKCTNFRMRFNQPIKGVTVSPTQFAMLKTYYSLSGSRFLSGEDSNNLQMFGHDIIPILEGIVIDPKDAYRFMGMEPGIDLADIEGVVNYGFDWKGDDNP